MSALEVYIAARLDLVKALLAIPLILGLVVVWIGLIFYRDLPERERGALKVAIIILAVSLFLFLILPSGEEYLAFRGVGIWELSE